MISRRSEINPHVDFLTKNFIKATSNRYDPATSPQGYINFGLTENKLCEDLWLKKIAEISRSPDFVSADMLYYYQMQGMKQLRENLSRFIEERFKSKQKIEEEKLTLMVGASAIINALAFTLADPGDVFLCPTPCYTRMRNDVLDMGGVDIYEVPMFEKNASEDPFRMRIDILESYLQKANQEDLTVRGLILISPNNPTGKVYTPHELQQLMEFCKREKLHIIADEISGLSTQGQSCFTSVLSLSVPDPERTHFVWGLSKDFGLSGFRCGVVYSHNRSVVKRLNQLATFSTIPAPTQKLINGIVSDTEWLDNVYFPTYYKRAAAAYNLVKEVLDELDIPTAYSCRNVIFIWMDLSQFLKEQTKEEEARLFNRFMDAGLYILPGMEMSCQIPGWFRLTFTLLKQDIQEGLRRFHAVLMDKEKQANVKQS